jgi:hypothetical protein
MSNFTISPIPNMTIPAPSSLQSDSGLSGGDSFSSVLSNAVHTR